MSARANVFAQNKVKQHINDNFSRFQRIQVKQLLRLRCFTDIDKQKISATCDWDGNNQAVFVFFQHLWAREGWVLLLIEALREDHMGDLAEELQQVYDRYLPPSPRTSPAASSPPAAHIPSDASLRPQTNERSSHGVASPSAVPVSPLGFATPTTNTPTQDMGDYHTPVQENHHPAEKSKLVVKPQATDKAREPDFSPPSNSNAASNIRAAVRGEKATDAQVALPEKESPSIPGPVEERPLLPPMASTTGVGSVEQKWDRRQHHPVMVKNESMGNVHRPEDSTTVSALPTDASGNQPEEDYYSTDSFVLAPGNQRESEAKDLLRERRVHILRVDQNQDWLENQATENQPVVDNLQSSLDAKKKRLPGEKLGVSPKASHRSAEDPTQLLSTDHSTRSSSANSAQLSLKQTGTKPPSQVPNTTSDQQFHPPSSDLGGSSPIDKMPPNPSMKFSAARGDTYSDDFKYTIEEKKPLREPDRMDTLPVGQEQAMETRPSAGVDCKRKNHIFYSNHTEDDMPSKPGVLSSVPGETAESTKAYSGTSERLCISNSDPILVSDTSSVGNPTANTLWGRKGVSSPGDASLPPKDENGEDETSIRTHNLQVVENPSMDLMGAPEMVPLGEASPHPSSRAFPDPTSECQPEKKAKDLSRASLPDEKAEAGTGWTANNSVLLFVGFALASVAVVAFVLYKKK
ncbi:mitochondrial antiviral-signaling protein isoform X1 [Python bivittatus]|uniref:Mitochondrial antiviral-signaling protein isoform X1 n=1 Tax=Python bivittatus TaxID=176946 RepID=A0A9F2R9R2_PYTBI|nr:mitochondrial antiviral-signaling protein isoform X1 [Python bivittatus]